MRPTQNMYATKEEWQEALIRWMNENPTLDNGKVFMVFEGPEMTTENYVFEGDLIEFADMYFAAKDWAEVLAFVAEQGYTVIVEDDERWDDIGIMLDEAEEDRMEMFYNEFGEESPGGIYDAGGHPNAERMAEWADDIRDRMRGK